MIESDIHFLLVLFFILFSFRLSLVSLDFLEPVFCFDNSTINLLVDNSLLVVKNIDSLDCSIEGNCTEHLITSDFSIDSPSDEIGKIIENPADS